MSVATAGTEVVMPNDNGDDYIEEGIQTAIEYSNQQPSVDAKFVATTEAARAFEPVEVGAMFPVSRRFGEAIHGARSRRRGAINSEHLILRYPDLPVNHG